MKKTISHDDISEIIIMTAATVYCFAKGEISKNVAIDYIESNTSLRKEFREAIKLVIDELSSPKGSDHDIDKVYEASLPFYNILSIKEDNGTISMKFSFNDTEYIASLEADKECATFFCERNTGYNPNILIAMWEEGLEDVNLQKLMECVQNVITHLS